LSQPAVVDAIEPVADLIVRRTGLVFPPTRRDALAAAVDRALARTRSRTIDRLVALLEKTPDALEELVSELTVTESYFFRAPEQFDFLRREVLPEILRRCPPDHRLRLLSIACAAGEEPYSLAILLEEEGLGQRSTIIGADISRPSLARAAQARYGSWSLRGTDEAFRSRYFRRSGSRFQLVPRLRERVELTWLNLAEDFHPSHATGIIGFDVIFCRNALIYFDARAIARVAARLFAALADGGWLFTGAFDPPIARHAPFEAISTPAGIVYRRTAHAASPTAEATTVPSPPVRREPASAPPPPIDDRGAARIRTLADAGRLTEAIEAAAEEARRHPASSELHFLRAVLLAETGRDREAADGFRRALYLDGQLAAAALALGFSLRRLGDAAGARRAFGRARGLLAGRPAGEPVPLADGESAGRLLMTTDVQIRLLEGAADE
jgi:chemotaxis protein methyltransferase CheR